MGQIQAINAVWKVIYFLTGLMGFVNFATELHSILQNVVPAMDTAKEALSYVYYFIPKGELQPIVHFVFYAGAVRIGMAVINLLWW